MTKVYYSTVLDQSADRVWGAIRDFNSYPEWVESVTESRIEEGKSGDAVGAIRSFVEYGTPIRQRLLAHSDLERLPDRPKSCQPLGDKLLSGHWTGHADRRWQQGVRRMVGGD